LSVYGFVNSKKRSSYNKKDSITVVLVGFKDLIAARESTEH